MDSLHTQGMMIHPVQSIYSYFPPLLRRPRAVILSPRPVIFNYRYLEGVTALKYFSSRLIPESHADINYRQPASDFIFFIYQVF